MKYEFTTALAALVLSVCAGVTAPAAPLEDGSAAYAKGDYATAIRLLRSLAERGVAKAEYDLAVMYANGRGVGQDFAEAAKWYRKAAEQGDVASEFNLGLMYDNGLGVTQNATEAAKWYRAAAERGDPKAAFNLGTMLAYGEGGKQNNVEALKWFTLAADRFAKTETDKRNDAILQRDVVMGKMSPAEIAEAQKLARAWKPK